MNTDIGDILDRYPLGRKRADEPDDAELGELMRSGLLSYDVSEIRESGRCLDATSNGVSANALGCLVIGAMAAPHHAVDAYREIRKRYRHARKPFDGVFACAALAGISEERARLIARLNVRHSASEIAAALKEDRIGRLEERAASAC